MAYFGPPAGISSWSGTCAWSGGCQAQFPAPAPVPQYYAAPPAPPAQYYPPQSLPQQSQNRNSGLLDMHPIFWILIGLIALRLCYSDFYWFVQCLPNPHPAQPAAAAAAPAANAKEDQKQQKDNNQKKDDNQKKDNNQKGGQNGKKSGKDQKTKDDEKAKEEKSKQDTAKDDKAKDEKEKDDKEDKAKDEKAKGDKSSLPVILRPSCKYFAGQRIWVTANGVRWWGVLVLDRGGGNWYGHKVVYGGKRYGRPELQTVPFFANETELEIRIENFGHEKEPRYVNKTIICGCP